MIIKEWLCMAHGDFEGPEQRCPHGCGESMVQRAFRTPPAIQSESYRGINKTFASLAADHGLTDMHNAGGDGMRFADAAAHKRLRQATEMVIGASKAGLTGTSAGDYFKPLREFNPGSSTGGVLQKSSQHTVTDSQGREHTYGSGTTLIDGAGALNLPTPQLTARPFNGTDLGLPAGDA